jgi:hypothetical protein
MLSLVGAAGYPSITCISLYNAWAVGAKTLEWKLPSARLTVIT